MVTECEIPPAQFLSEKPDKALARPGVYAILCDANGRYYVGSSKDMCIRMRHHVNSLISGKHHNPRMQHSFSKYGASRFLFRVLEVTERTSNAMVERERKWIADLDSVKSGFNVMPAANCPLGVVRDNRASFKAASIARSMNPNSNSNRKYHFISPEGKSFKGFNVARFCREQGFTLGMKNNFQKLAKGDIGSYNGWTVPGAKPIGRRRGWPSDFSLTDKNGVIHTGNNLSKFCISIGVRKSFFNALINHGMKNKAGWTVTPGFVFKRQKGMLESFELISPTGILTRFSSVKDFAKENDLKPKCLRLFLSSNAKQHKGWTKNVCF